MKQMSSSNENYFDKSKKIIVILLNYYEQKA